MARSGDWLEAEVADIYRCFRVRRIVVIGAGAELRGRRRGWLRL